MGKIYTIILIVLSCSMVAGYTHKEIYLTGPSTSYMNGYVGVGWDTHKCDMGIYGIRRGVGIGFLYPPGIYFKKSFNMCASECLLLEINAGAGYSISDRIPYAFISGYSGASIKIITLSDFVVNANVYLGLTVDSYDPMILIGTSKKYVDDLNPLSIMFGISVLKILEK